MKTAACFGLFDPVRLLIIACTMTGVTSTAHAAITISSSPTQNMSCADGVCSPTAASANLNTSDVANDLASGNLKVTTTGTGGVQATDIIVAGSFNWTSASSLTLDAYHSITFNQPVADNGSGAVTLMTNDGGSGGMLSFVQSGSLSFLGTSNSVAINGTGYTLENSLPFLAAAIAANPSGAYAFASNYDASKDGTYTHSPVPTTFSGNFQGLGNTMSNVTINGSRIPAIGGLFAELSGGTVNNISLLGLNMYAKYDGDVGGLVGWLSSGSMFGDHVSGKLVGGRAMGGFVGVSGSNTTIENSSAAVHVKGRRETAGFVGDNGGLIADCLASGKVQGGPNSGIGGLVAANDGSISNSYATGPVSGGASAEVGGLVGDNEGAITTSYSTGSVLGGVKSQVGGFIGLNDRNDISDSYWDTTTSGTNVGVGSGSNTGVTGLTSKQLQSGLPAGFDPSVWAENPNINNGLPYLIANPPR